MDPEASDVVVGAGIVGLCCALQLQRGGRRVVVLDPREPGDGCSFGNSGLISGGQVVPDAMPGLTRRVVRQLRDPDGPLAVRWLYVPRLARWVPRHWASSRPERVTMIAGGLAALGRHALPCFDAMLQECDAAALIRRSGWLYLYETDAAFRAARPGIELRERHGIVLEQMDGVAIRRMLPALGPDFAHGLYATDAAHAVDPKRLSLRLAEHFQRRGGTIRRERVRAFEIADGVVRAVITGDGQHPAAMVVLAAGAWSGPLAGRLGAHVPLAAERGYHVMFPTPAIELAVPFSAASAAVAITPMLAGLRVTGTVELAPPDAPPDPRRIAQLQRRARMLFPDLNDAGRRDWMGPRPATPDTLPVIGPAPRARNALLAFGHGHRGLALAAVTGRLIADLAIGRPPLVDPAPYAATRFG